MFFLEYSLCTLGTLTTGLPKENQGNNPSIFVDISLYLYYK